MTDLQLPLEVHINGKKNDNFKAFDVSFSLEKFVDTFNIEFNNYKGMSSTTVPVGALVEIYSQGVLIFRGIIENKQVKYANIGSTMTCSGREEIVVLTETDVSPNIGPFKNYIDNDIIKLLLKDYSRDMSLGTGKKIKEYSVSGKSVRIGQVIEDICKFNDFLIYKRGNTIYKKPRPEDETGLNTGPQYFLNVDDEKFYLNQDRIMTVDISEDITAVRSIVNGFTYTSGKGKAQAKSGLKNTQLTSGSYASRIRNRCTMRGYKLNRVGNVLTPAKDKAELGTSTLNLLRESDMKCTLTIELFGIQDIKILDVIRVDIESEKIAQNMRVKEINYKFDTSNKSITKITVAPFIKLSS